jgi:hypothetical protein
MNATLAYPDWLQRTRNKIYEYIIKKDQWKETRWCGDGRRYPD